MNALKFRKKKKASRPFTVDSERFHINLSIPTNLLPFFHFVSLFLACLSLFSIFFLSDSTCFNKLTFQSLNELPPEHLHDILTSFELVTRGSTSTEQREHPHDLYSPQFWFISAFAHVRTAVKITVGCDAQRTYRRIHFYIAMAQIEIGLSRTRPNPKRA